ncbi:hypothetical protein [Planomonospora sp. ID82291]|uniref:hypothetical protein n=1 Tax=Planomonospora sp. ID82291 TaxID=2738136 RepID=UPI0018C3E4D1|nr:hypothetical protein [Planomonospora sp. ID82291]MBG0819077.1 hypothetical protein [Planomonospora sp. ID82291]
MTGSQRRHRDPDGQRTRRVNLRLSEDEHAELQAAADAHRLTLAGYAASAALTLARDQLPPDMGVQLSRLFVLHTRFSLLASDVGKLLQHAETGEPIASAAAVEQTIEAVRLLMDDAEEELVDYVRLLRSERHRRALRLRRERRARQKTPATAPPDAPQEDPHEPGTAGTPARRAVTAPAEPAAVPATARAWLTALDAFGGQVRAGELGRQHWHHAKLYNALIGALVDLGAAYPGGLEHLERDAARRKR